MKREKHEQNDRELEELCSWANKKLEQLLPAMQEVHRETAQIYVEIRNKLLGGEELTENDRKKMEETIEVAKNTIEKAYDDFWAEIDKEKNIILSSILKLRTHRVISLPLGILSGQEDTFVSYLDRYLETNNPEDLPEPKELKISDLHIKPEDLKATKADFKDKLKTIIFVTFSGNEKIEVKFEFPEEKLTVDYYEHIDFEAFRELFTNATAAMPGGGKIEVIGKKSKDDKNLVISISDTGHGMSPEVLKKALTDGFTTKAGGTGRGLGFVKEYFEKIRHGKFKIQSEKGKGTTVTIILPLSK